MTNEELIAKFNPATAGSLTDTDLELMRKLTDDQLGALARAYPNPPVRKAYLILFDTTLKENKQLWTLSTWQNLFNVRKFSNKKNLIPWTFKALFQPQARQPQQPRPQSGLETKKLTVDLSAEEAGKELKKAIANRQQDQKKTETKTAGSVKKVTAEKKAPPQKKTPVPAPKVAKGVSAEELEKMEADANKDGSEEFTDGQGNDGPQE